jgi:hypothetical protein
MEGETTLGDIYEDIAERLATARTRALMGERQEALGVFRGASLDYLRFRDVLVSYPGFQALDHAFNVTLTVLSAEQSPASHARLSTSPARSSKARKRIRQAA